MNEENRTRQREKLGYNAVSRNILVYPMKKLGGLFRVVTSLGKRAVFIFSQRPVENENFPEKECVILVEVAVFI